MWNQQLWGPWGPGLEHMGATRVPGHQQQPGWGYASPFLVFLLNGLHVGQQRRQIRQLIQRLYP